MLARSDIYRSRKMHDLFTTVLSKRDLSRAGELFSVADSEIVNDLSEVVSLILLMF